MRPVHCAQAALVAVVLLSLSAAVPSFGAPAGFGLQLGIHAPGVFGGKWRTRTSVGGDFILTIADNNSNVTGTFVEKNPAYNGSLQGHVDTSGTLTYTWTQVTGAAGSGMFKMSDDERSISGVFSVNGDATQYSWSGSRM